MPEITFPGQLKSNKILCNDILTDRIIIDSNIDDVKNWETVLNLETTDRKSLEPPLKVESQALVGNLNVEYLNGEKLKSSLHLTKELEQTKDIISLKDTNQDAYFTVDKEFNVIIEHPSVKYQTINNAETIMDEQLHVEPSTINFYVPEWLQPYVNSSVIQRTTIGLNPSKDSCGTIGTNDKRYEQICSVNLFGNLLSSSDERIKENIEDRDVLESYNIIKSIKLRNYNYTNPTNHMGINFTGTVTGVIAQELKEILPEAVMQTKGIINGNTVDDFNMVDKNRLIMELIGAVKELQNKIEKLEN